MSEWLVTYLPGDWSIRPKRVPMSSDHRSERVYSPDVAHCLEQFHPGSRIVAVTLRPADILRIEAAQMRETRTA